MLNIIYYISEALDDLWMEMGYDDYMMCQAAHDEFDPKEWDATAKAIWLSKIESFDAYYVLWLDKEEPPQPFFEVRHVMLKG